MTDGGRIRETCAAAERAHVFCSCWGPDPALHEGHCCFLVRDGARVVGREERCAGTTEADWQNAVETARQSFEIRLESTRADVAEGRLSIEVAKRRYPHVTDWAKPVEVHL